MYIYVCVLINLQGAKQEIFFRHIINNNRWVFIIHLKLEKAMGINLLKVSMITALGIFVASTEASAVNKKSDKKSTPSTSSAPKTTTTTKKVVVSPSKVVYKKPTPTVQAVRTIPKTTVVVKNKGLDYHYSNGSYYRYSGGRYIVVPAPKGARVKTLPIGYTLLKLLDRTYYYYQGAYYLQSGSSYQVVDAPQDIIVPTLPEESDLITMEGKDYYVYDGCIYSIVLTPDGKAFKMVGQLDI